MDFSLREIADVLLEIIGCVAMIAVIGVILSQGVHVQSILGGLL